MREWTTYNSDEPSELTDVIFIEIPCFRKTKLSITLKFH